MLFFDALDRGLLSLANLFPLFVPLVIETLHPLHCPCLDLLDLLFHIGLVLKNDLSTEICIMDDRNSSMKLQFAFLKKGKIMHCLDFVNGTM